MKPVFQTRFSPLGGNCMMACWASIFETSIEVAGEMPNGGLGNVRNAADTPKWWEWFHDRTLRTGTHIAVMLYDAVGAIPMGYSILCGCAPDSFNGHAVVCFDGNVVHDPLPKHAGTPYANLEVVYYIAFLRTRLTPRR